MNSDYYFAYPDEVCSVCGQKITKTVINGCKSAKTPERKTDLVVFDGESGRTHLHDLFITDYDIATLRGWLRFRWHWRKARQVPDILDGIVQSGEHAGKRIK